MDHVKHSIFRFVGLPLLLLIAIITTQAYAADECKGEYTGTTDCYYQTDEKCSATYYKDSTSTTGYYQCWLNTHMYNPPYGQTGTECQSFSECQPACTKTGSACATTDSKCCSTDPSANCDNKCTPCTETGTACASSDSWCCSKDPSATCENKCTPCTQTGFACASSDSKCCSTDSRATCENKCTPCIAAGNSCGDTGLPCCSKDPTATCNNLCTPCTPEGGTCTTKDTKCCNLGSSCSNGEATCNAPPPCAKDGSACYGLQCCTKGLSCTNNCCTADGNACITPDTVCCSLGNSCSNGEKYCGDKVLGLEHTDGLNESSSSVPEKKVKN